MGLFQWVHCRSNTSWAVILRNPVYHDLSMDLKFSISIKMFDVVINLRNTKLTEIRSRIGFLHLS